jgi:hypothetical protein
MEGHMTNEMLNEMLQRIILLWLLCQWCEYLDAINFMSPSTLTPVDGRFVEKQRLNIFLD